MAEDLARAFPDDRVIRSFIIASSQRIGDALVFAGCVDEALAVHRRSLAAADDLARQDPDGIVSRCAQALSLQKIAECLVRNDASEDALVHLERSTGILEDVVARDRSAIEPQTHLAQNYLDAGVILATIDPGRAIAMLRKSLALRERIAASDPGDMTMQREIAVACSLLGEALHRFERDAEAREAYRRAVAILRSVAASDPENLRWRHDLSIGCRRLGEAERLARQHDDASTFLRAATQLGETLVEADPANPGWRESLAASYGALSRVLRELGRVEEAAATGQRNAELRAQTD
jgi:tetratricopeptide (TPR) repeat protein